MRLFIRWKVLFLIVLLSNAAVAQNKLQQYQNINFSRVQITDDFWKPKIARNKARDREVGQTLRALGWRILRFWEHSLNEPEKVLARLQAKLASRTKHN